MTFHVINNNKASSWEDEFETALGGSSSGSAFEQTDTDEAFRQILSESLIEFTGDDMEARKEWFATVIEAMEAGFPVRKEDIIERGLMSMDDFLKLDIPPAKPLIKGLLNEAESMLVHAPSGAGKSIISQMLSLWASGEGHSLGCWDNGEGNHKVMYIDGEMSVEIGQNRFKGLQKLLPVDGSNFHYFSVIGSKATELHLLVEDYQKALLSTIEKHGIKLVVIDNFRTLAGGGDENNASTVAEFNKFIDAIHSLGCSAIVIHHSNKALNSEGWPVYAGSTNFERPYSVVMALKTLHRYSEQDPKQVMGFKITKQRGSNLSAHEGSITIDDIDGITVDGKGVEPIEFTAEELQTIKLLEKQFSNALDDDFVIPHGAGTRLWNECCMNYHDKAGYKDKISVNVQKILRELRNKRKAVERTQAPFLRVDEE